MALEPGQFKIIRGVVADSNEDGTLEIRLPGVLPGAEDSDDAEEATDTIDGIPCITAGATRGGYSAGDRIAVAYYDEQVSPQDRYLVLGVILDGTNADDDAHADAGLLKSPKGGAKVICDEDDDGNNPTVQLGSSAASRGVGRIDDETTSDTETDNAFWTWLAGFVSVITDSPPTPQDGGVAWQTAIKTWVGLNPVPDVLKGKITTASDKVFCDDDVEG